MATTIERALLEAKLSMVQEVTGSMDKKAARLSAYRTVYAMGESIDTGINAAQAVIANWESGDLAAAVNMLESWLEDARKLRAGK